MAGHVCVCGCNQYLGMLHGSNILGILGSLSKHDALSNRDILDDSIYKKRWMSQLNTNRYYLVNFDFEAEQLSKAVGASATILPCPGANGRNLEHRRFVFAGFDGT